jgi:hypothetical protein
MGDTSGSKSSTGSHLLQRFSLPPHRGPIAPHTIRPNQAVRNSGPSADPSNPRARKAKGNAREKLDQTHVRYNTTWWLFVLRDPRTTHDGMWSFNCKVDFLLKVFSRCGFNFFPAFHGIPPCQPLAPAFPDHPFNLDQTFILRLRHQFARLPRHVWCRWRG